MSNQVDREGTFRGTITGYALHEADSGAVAINIVAKLEELYSGDAWHPWSDYDQEASGSLWIGKKDGTPNKPAVENLVRHAGWDGDILSIIKETWTPTPCQFTIKNDEYEGKTRLRIAFVNAHDRKPGGAAQGNVDETKAKALAARFGSQFRAIAAEAKRNGVKPGGKPPVPPPPPAPVGPALPPPGTGDDVPF